MGRKRVYEEGTVWLHVPVPKPAADLLLEQVAGDAKAAARRAGEIIAEYARESKTPESDEKAAEVLTGE